MFTLHSWNSGYPAKKVHDIPPTFKNEFIRIDFSFLCILYMNTNEYIYIDFFFHFDICVGTKIANLEPNPTQLVVNL